MVPRNHSADSAAREMVESRYYNHGCDPMLPWDLTLRDLSLLERVSHEALLIQCRLGEGYDLLGVHLEPVRISSKAKLAYEDIPGILMDRSHPGNEVLRLAERTALGLLEIRRSRGDLVFYDLNDGWYTNEEGFLLRLERSRANVGYIIVQEMMILASAAVGAYCAENEIPILFRNHTAKAHAPERQVLLDQFSLARSGVQSVDFVRAQTHMVLNKAEYSSVLKGHFGLSLPAYTHCTSPIRRYADLVTQRQLLAHLTGSEYPYSRDELAEIAEHINHVLRAKRANWSEALKQRATERAEKNAERMQPKYMAELKPKEFERLVKTVVRAGSYHEGLTEAVRLRIRANTLALLDVYYILFETPRNDSQWGPIRGELFRYLSEYPNHAVTVLAIGFTLGIWTEPTFAQTKTGRHFRVSVTVSFQNEERTGSGSGPNIKNAKQNAAVSLVKHLLGADATFESNSVPSPVQDVSNPVGVIMEWAQQHRFCPEFTASQDGDNPPMFRATVKIGAHKATSAARGTKKAAKTEAALLLAQQIGLITVPISPAP
jgi:ribonuclease R